MKTIKELKKEARKSLKKHIVLYAIICSIATFIGAEFIGSLFSLSIQKENTFEAITSSIMNNGVDATKKKIDDYIIETRSNETEMLGRTNGVFAHSLNAISSGSLYMVGFTVFKNITNSPTLILAITIIIATGVYFLFWCYIVNTYPIVIRRIFLEGRTYKKVPFRRLFFLVRIRKWDKVARTMIIKSILQSLWNFTVVGGIIKHYSYLMVPYILAENPDVNAIDAINMSREMMDGHKLEAFKIDASFIGWHILGLLTYGAISLLFTNPYQTATFTEFYKELRDIAKEKSIKNADLLNDTYLYEFADDNLIEKKYRDILTIIKQEDYTFKKRRGLKLFIYEFLGIHSYTEEEKNYEAQQLKKFAVDEYTPILNKERYPFRLFTIKPKRRRHMITTLNYMRHYSLISIIYMFFIISFAGWLWEVVLYLLNEGIFVNRGTLQGPWVPIYGVGAIFILLFLNRFRKNVPLLFILATIFCGIIEYFTSVCLESMYNGIRWWDYSGYFLNLHGRICAEGLLTFGFGGLFVVYFLAPAIDNKIRTLNKKVLAIIAIILISLYTIDTAYSIKNPNTGRGINDYQIQNKAR